MYDALLFMATNVKTHDHINSDHALFCPLVNGDSAL
ncbi:hypothetical protein [Klebsiella phage vB_KvaS_F1M1D]|nr:hypothetical protein [Klebsiella phage vB_KvaS_F1M1D]